MARQKKESKVIQLDDGTNITILDDMKIGKHGDYNKRLLFPNNIFNEDELLCVLSMNDFQKLIQHNTSDTIQEQTSTISNLSDNVASLKQRLQSKDDEIFELKQECDKHKKTIENQQSDIHQMDETITSLSQLKDNIPIKQHHDELDALKDDITELKLQLEKSDGILSTKLAEQKQQLSIAYVQEIDAIKDEYNLLVSEYNHLLDDVESISKLDVLFGKHKNKIKNKEKKKSKILNQQTFVATQQELLPKQ